MKQATAGTSPSPSTPEYLNINFCITHPNPPHAHLPRNPIPHSRNPLRHPLNPQMPRTTAGAEAQRSTQRLEAEGVTTGVRKARMHGPTACGGTWGHAGGGRQSLRCRMVVAVAATQRRGSLPQRLLLHADRRRRRRFSNPRVSYVKSRPRTVPGEGGLHSDRYFLYSVYFQCLFCIQLLKCPKQLS